MKFSLKDFSSKCYQIRNFQFPKLSMTHLKLVQSFGFMIHKIDLMSSRLLMFFLILCLSSFTPCSSVSIVNFEWVNAGWDYSWYMSILKRLNYIGTYFPQKYQTFLSDNLVVVLHHLLPLLEALFFLTLSLHANLASVVTIFKTDCVVIYKVPDRKL